jgi:trimethylamine--corrinoid protein Co-methyltransferase
MTKRFIAGMEVTAETLARGVIDRVGPGGNFLADKHTVQWFREELWRPRLLTRQNYATWQDGGAKDMAQRVQERLVELVETHQVRPLAEETVAALERIKRERQEQVK